MLKDAGYTVPEIRNITNNYHDYNTGKWIHRFNEKCINGITSKNTQAQANQDNHRWYRKEDCWNSD